MAQLTIYLDEETARKARLAARREGVSLSRWARTRLGEAADEGRVWPAGFHDLYGSIADSTFQVAEDTPVAYDSKREEL